MPESVTSLGANSFGGCKGLESIAIPDGVKLISDCAFLNCSNLKMVSFGAAVEEIGQSAFSGCISLQNVVFPDGVKVVNNSAFYNCCSITEVIFGQMSQLVTIGKNAFNGCTAVHSVVVPATVKSVGASAFSGCSGTLVVNADIADATASAGAYYGSSFKNVVVGDNPLLLTFQRKRAPLHQWSKRRR